MESSNNYNINILDLSDEMLLAILNKLNMVDVLYSLVYVNKRFNRLILDPFYIHNLDLTVKHSLLQRVSPLDIEKIDTICKKILARIHHHIYKLTVPLYLIESILNIDYPQLQSLSLVNFEEEKFLECLTEETFIYRLLTNQITHLNVDIFFDKNESNIFLLILSLGKHLTDLTYYHHFSSEHLGHPTFDLSLTHICSTLTKLIINVTTFDDCLYLLDGNLQSLTALIIDINKISDSLSILDNTRKLPQLKQFSLTSYHLTYVYDEKVILLLHRMINIEDLTLFLNVVRFNSTYIDGTHLYNDILVFMPQLQKFTFSINTSLSNSQIVFPSNDDIQYSFIEKGNRHVGSYVQNRLSMQIGQCHVYSLPYQFDSYLLLCNSFQGGIFDKVRSMKMIDTYPFEYELFEKISQHFPFLQNLTLDNFDGQKDKQHSSTFITFPHLEQLDITFTHVDYAEQFLFEKNTRLSRLLELHIGYDTLAIVTNNFTNDLARFNCSQIKRLVTKELYVPPKDFHLYFPLL
ncbi:unnamed protein product [Rotaria sordida]|uniref:F-box domain-containing protein n=1 Tax=Rotaria sordida TaxID=392033 RepID=A0A814I748_9BILA|nr:unnamed protein product [Rotaria sordida]CAF3986239.1 unnamed protein product [Rotaria sordida]